MRTYEKLLSVIKVSREGHITLINLRQPCLITMESIRHSHAQECVVSLASVTQTIRKENIWLWKINRDLSKPLRSACQILKVPANMHSDGNLACARVLLSPWLIESICIRGATYNISGPRSIRKIRFPRRIKPAADPTLCAPSRDSHYLRFRSLIPREVIRYSHCVGAVLARVERGDQRVYKSVARLLKEAHNRMHMCALFLQLVVYYTELFCGAANMERAKIAMKEL